MVQRVHKYADGGKVKKDHLKKAPTAPRMPKPSPNDLGTGMASKAGDILQNKRKKQMEDLGL